MMRIDGFTLLISVLTGCLMFTVGLLVWDVVTQGLPHLSVDFLFNAPENAGRDGGIYPILVATAWVLVIALLSAVPVGLGVAVCLVEFTAQDSRFAHTVRRTLDVMAGVPSIVYGLFGYAFFSSFLGLGFSLLAGGLTLACMILPLFIRSCELGLRQLDPNWRTGAQALGMRLSPTVLHVLLPAASPAILSGLILSLGRATGETAALLFTSGYVDRLPESVFDPGRVLSVHIFDLSMNVAGGDAAAYASGLVLISLILILTSLAQYVSDRIIQRRFSHHV